MGEKKPGWHGQRVMGEGRRRKKRRINLGLFGRHTFLYPQSVFQTVKPEAMRSTIFTTVTPQTLGQCGGAPSTYSTSLVPLMSAAP